MELAEAFYCGQLGFEKKFQNKPTENADPSYIGIIRDGIWLHLSSFSGDGVSGTVVSIAVTDVDAFHEEFKSNGVKIGMEPVTQTWGTREMGLDDPSGNNLRFGTWV
jgi:uncharacterized glyoxalase superfamily protein PhnB